MVKAVDGKKEVSLQTVRYEKFVRWTAMGEGESRKEKNTRHNSLAQNGQEIGGHPNGGPDLFC